MAVTRVSIHVPLAEHDMRAVSAVIAVSVSIHVPLAEHDAPCILKLFT